MRLDRPRADAQPLADAPRREPRDREIEHLALARREPVQLARTRVLAEAATLLFHLLQRDRAPDVAAALGDRAHRLDQVLRALILRHVAEGANLQRVGDARLL